jgi:hypothetical protein
MLSAAPRPFGAPFFGSGNMLILYTVNINNMNLAVYPVFPMICIEITEKREVILLGDTAEKYRSSAPCFDQ